MSETTMHRKRCEQEATRDVIFLFQIKRWIHMGVPEGYDTDGDSIWKREDNEDEGPEHYKWSELLDMEDDNGKPFIVQVWETESVWLDRDEAEDFGKRKSYNYGLGWRVYGVPAEGDLATMLRG